MEVMVVGILAVATLVWVAYPLMNPRRFVYYF